MPPTFTTKVAVHDQKLGMYVEVDGRLFGPVVKIAITQATDPESGKLLRLVDFS